MDLEKVAFCVKMVVDHPRRLTCSVDNIIVLGVKGNGLTANCDTLLVCLLPVSDVHLMQSVQQCLPVVLKHGDKLPAFVHICRLLSLQLLFGRQARQSSSLRI